MKLFGLELDTGGLVAIIVATGGALLFFATIYSNQAAEALQIKSLQDDVQPLKDAIPEIQRSVGRIEGYIKGMTNENKRGRSQ